MRSSGAVQVLLAVGLLVVALSPLVAPVPGGDGVPTPNVPGDVFAPTGSNDRMTSWGESPDGDRSTVVDRRLTPSVDREVNFVAEVGSADALPERIVRRFGEVYTHEGTRRISGTVSLSEVPEFSATQGVQAVHITGIESEEVSLRDERVSAGVEAIGATALQDRGVTGEGVTVGVIDSGFVMSHPSIADSVGAYRSFSKSGSPVHGTAVASVVADTAPGAELHLAAVGATTTPSEYRAAVRWLDRSGADVIVDAGSYFGQPGDGSGGIDETVANVSDDVAFVTSAGNYANRHWQGVDRPAAGNASGWVEFAPGAEGNHLRGGQRISGRVTLGLQWNGSADYDLYLYRNTPASDWAWGSSTGEGSSEHLSAVVPPGRYYVAIRADTSNATGPHHVELFANHPLEYRDAAGSLTSPATASGAIAVGAVNGTTVEAFSSRGPTADGRPGVDVVAPDAVDVRGVDVGGGTSFSAPYVAGTIALLKSANPDLSAARLGDIVVRSARDVGPPGPDPAAGYGRVDAVAAARLVATSTARAPAPPVEIH